MMVRVSLELNSYISQETLPASLFQLDVDDIYYQKKGLTKSRSESAKLWTVSCLRIELTSIFRSVFILVHFNTTNLLNYGELWKKF